MSKKDVAAQEGDLVKFSFSNRTPLIGVVLHQPYGIYNEESLVSRYTDTPQIWIIDTLYNNAKYSHIIYIQQYNTMEIIQRKGA